MNIELKKKITKIIKLVDNQKLTTIQAIEKIEKIIDKESNDGNNKSLYNL